MLGRALIHHGVYIPISDSDVSRLEKLLTFKVWDTSSQSNITVKDFYKHSNGIVVPRVFGAKYCKRNGIDLVDNLSAGMPIGGYNPIALRDYQIQFVDDICSDLSKNLVTLARAATGKGKTVCSLEVMRRLRRTAIVIVDQEFLKNQWISEAKKFLKIPDEKIGIVQGKVFDYKGKDFVIAMAQTLYRKDYDEDFANYFGLMVCDESDTLGAKQFSRVFTKVNAKYRLGVSATPNRTDGLQRIIQNHLGEVSVELGHLHKKSHARFIEYEGVISWYSNISPKSGRYITEISEDTNRNWLLVDVICRMRSTGRKMLVLSDRIEQLENLMSMCEYAGIPTEDMGLVSGYRNVWKFDKNPTPARKPANLERGAEYTPIKLQRVRKRIPKDVLDFAKNNSKIIFASYGMFKKGVDVPTLSAGLDCTPRAKAEQVHGRILRETSGKKMPIWVTVRDSMSYRAEYQFANRIKEYIKSNAEIYEWHLEKGLKKVTPDSLIREVARRVEYLKKQKIITNIEGRNIIMIQSTGS